MRTPPLKPNYTHVVNQKTEPEDLETNQLLCVHRHERQTGTGSEGVIVVGVFERTPEFRLLPAPLVPSVVGLDSLRGGSRRYN